MNTQSVSVHKTALNANVSTKTLVEGSSVFVRVLKNNGGGKYTVSFAGNRFLINSPLSLKEGEAFLSKITIQNQKIVLQRQLENGVQQAVIENIKGLFSPDGRILDGRLSTYFEKLGLIPDNINYELFQTLKSLGLPFSVELFSKVRRLAFQFKGNELKAAKAALILHQKGISLTKENIRAVLDGFSEDEKARKDDGGFSEREDNFHQNEEQNRDGDGFSGKENGRDGGRRASEKEERFSQNENDFFEGETGSEDGQFSEKEESFRKSMEDFSKEENRSDGQIFEKEDLSLDKSASEKVKYFSLIELTSENLTAELFKKFFEKLSSLDLNKENLKKLRRNISESGRAISKKDHENSKNPVILPLFNHSGFQKKGLSGTGSWIYVPVEFFPDSGKEEKIKGVVSFFILSDVCKATKVYGDVGFSGKKYKFGISMGENPQKLYVNEAFDSVLLKKKLPEMEIILTSEEDLFFFTEENALPLVDGMI